MPRRNDRDRAHRLRDSQLYSGYRLREKRRYGWEYRRQRQRSTSIDVNQPSVMQSRLDFVASIAGLAGIIGGSLLVAMDNPTGWVAIASGVMMDAAALSQIIKAETYPPRSQTFRSSRLSYSDSGANSSYGQPGLPMPEPSAVFDFMETNYPSSDNSES